MGVSAIVALPLLGAILPPLFARAGRTPALLAALTPSVAALVLLWGQGAAVFSGEPVVALTSWVPSLGLEWALRIDGLGFFFASLILVIGVLIFIYSRGYLAGNEPLGTFYAYLLLFQGAMLGVVLADNLLLLPVFWELTSLSSFLLIGFWRHLQDGRRGARLALAITGAGGLALLAGLILLGEVAGTYRISELAARREVILAAPLAPVILALILLGAFTKSAQFPFHFWLPHAMAAPTPVSAYLHSATMVKAGLYLLARVWPVFGQTDAWVVWVTGVGAATMLLGATIALFKDDLKALLAYSTVSHLGLVTMLLGLGTPTAVFAAMLHVLMHATFKAALFMNTGIVDHETGLRDLRRLSGLAKVMPLTAGLGTLAALSMAGVPPLNGFVSKEAMLVEVLAARWGGGWPLWGLVGLAAILSAAYAFRYFSALFFGPLRLPEGRIPHDPPALLWGPPLVLVVAVVVLGLWPSLAEPLLAAASAAAVGAHAPWPELALWHGFGAPLVVSAVAFVIGAAMVWHYRALSGRVLAWALPFDGRRAFFSAQEWLVRGAHRLIARVHSGVLGRYVLLLAVVSLAALALGWGMGEGWRPQRAPTPMNGLGLIFAGVGLAAIGLVVRWHHKRLRAVLLTGAVGLVVSLAFLHASAPDLALTQISVEAVTTVLLLLMLFFLPQHDTEPVAKPRGAAAASILIGAVVGLLAWVMMRNDGPNLADYFWSRSVSEGGGSNVVNVILVDFRGYDTFGEITVLGIAALVIYALLQGMQEGVAREHLHAWRFPFALSPTRHPLPFAVTARVMLPFLLMAVFYIFFRGHNAPGGGFIAALLLALAFLIQYMASGLSWTMHRMRLDAHVWIGTGLLVAGATGMAAMGLGAPFLRSAHGEVHIPGIGPVPLASAMGFDLGVLLTVFGAVTLALVQLAHLGQLAGFLPSRTPMDPARPKPSEKEG
jgi:multicomponent K+:H+ antiporter subunit A